MDFDCYFFFFIFWLIKVGEGLGEGLGAGFRHDLEETRIKVSTQTSFAVTLTPLTSLNEIAFNRLSTNTALGLNLCLLLSHIVTNFLFDKKSPRYSWGCSTNAVVSDYSH